MSVRGKDDAEQVQSKKRRLDKTWPHITLQASPAAVICDKISIVITTIRLS